MKKIILLAAMFISTMAAAQAAGPSLYANETSAIDTATLSVNGAGAIPCVLGVNANGNIKCPLDSVAAPGTYTLLITVTKAGTIVNTGTGATNSAGGSGVSAPFSYTNNSVTVAAPGNPKVAP